MARRDDGFRVAPFYPGGWVAWHEYYLSAPGPHQVTIGDGKPGAYYMYTAVKGRSPFEALSRLKKQLEGRA